MTREVTALAENFRRQESDNRATNEDYCWSFLLEAMRNTRMREYKLGKEKQKWQDKKLE